MVCGKGKSCIMSECDSMESCGISGCEFYGGEKMRNTIYGIYKLRELKQLCVRQENPVY